MQRAGNKCSYKNCEKGKRSHPGLHMFTFPVKNKKICRQWILNCGGGNDLLDLLPNVLKNRRICENHFETCAFVNNLRQRLNPSSVPIPIDPIKNSLEETISQQKLIIPKKVENESTMYDLEPLILKRTTNPKSYGRLNTINNTSNSSSFLSNIKMEQNKGAEVFLPTTTTSIAVDENIIKTELFDTNLLEEDVDVHYSKLSFQVQSELLDIKYEIRNASGPANIKLEKPIPGE